MAEKLSAAGLELVCGLFLFRDVSAELVSRAVADPVCRTEKYSKGDMIFTPQSFERCLGILLSGTVRVSRDSRDGGSYVISALHRGDIFGAAALFTEQNFETCLRAEQDCQVLFIPQPKLEWLMRRDFKIAENYIRYLSERIHFLNSRISGLIAGSAEQKLAEYLLAGEDEGVVRVPVSMSELARSLDLGRASLYRALDALSEAGIIAREGRNIEILDIDSLQNV